MVTIRESDGVEGPPIRQDRVSIMAHLKTFGLVMGGGALRRRL
jgi:hypothetical protein